MTDADYKTLRRQAMDCLARREHSRHELQQRLLSPGASPDGQALVDRVLADLAVENLQSDQRFAEMAVRYHGRRGKGPLWIRQWLQQRGVASGLIGECLQAGDWPALAREARDKRFGSALPQTAAERARQQRFLQQRGFASSDMHGLWASR